MALRRTCRAKGRLKRVLEDWALRIRAITSITRADASPPRPFALLVDAPRHRG